MARPREEALHPALEGAGLTLGLQDQGAQHGRQGQGHHAGDQHGGGQGEGEFGEQGPHQAAHEADGRIDRHQGRRHGDDRHRQFPRPLDGGRGPVLAGLDVAVDVLDHHDGVVYHQPDGEHKGKQSQKIDGES